MSLISETSGNITVITYSDESYGLILDSYIGPMPEGLDSVKYLRIFCHGNSILTTSINLSSDDKLDRILISGDGLSTTFLGNIISATCVEIQNISFQAIKISANVCLSESAKLSTISELDDNYQYVEILDPKPDSFIEALGHAYFKNSTLNISSYVFGISGQYILFQNCKLLIEAISASVYSDNRPIFEFCNIEEYSVNTIITTSEVVDDFGNPKKFINATIVDEYGQVVVISTLKKYGQGLVVLANDYDMFKESTGYTTVDLHRRINQSGEILKGRPGNYITDRVIDEIVYGYYKSISPENEAISDEVILEICDGRYVYDGHPHYPEPIKLSIIQEIVSGRFSVPNYNDFGIDEVASRHYDIGIYSKNSYRVTTYTIHDEDSVEVEIP